MTDARHVSIRTDKFRIAYEAMRALASKALPTAESEMKFALFVKSYEKTYDATTAALKKNEDATGRKIGNRTQLTPAGEARRDRIAAVLLTVKLPPKDCLVKKADLPKHDDEADKDVDNYGAVALLASHLGPFYDHEVSGEKKELLDTELDADSLAALDAAYSEAIDAPAVGERSANDVAVQTAIDEASA